MLNASTGYWDYWELYHKVTFDGPNKLIRVNFGETNIEVKADLYSAWKEWSQLENNLKYDAAFRSVGGDPLPQEGQFVDVILFLINGWRIISWEGARHVVNIDGNLVTEEGDSPYLNNGWGSFQSQVSAIFRVFQDAAEDTGISNEDVEKIRDAVVPAVWQALSADYSGETGSIAELMKLIYERVESAALASAIWDAIATDYNNPNSAGALLQKKKISAVLGDIIKEI